MSNKTKVKASPCTIFYKSCPDLQIPPKQPEKYIIVNPKFFEDVIKRGEGVDLVYTIDLRETSLNYQERDIEHERFVQADFYHNKFYDGMLLYVERQRRLFSCIDILAAAELIYKLRAQEAAKVINPPIL